jgi:phosphomannomutase
MKQQLILFDVDGTITPPRKNITKDMLQTLKQLTSVVDIGFVGGSDLTKQIEQIGVENFSLFKWRFAENGLVSYCENKIIREESFIKKFGEIHFAKLINICLYVLSTTECPIKRGTFIENRNGMINISPIGRSCSQNERTQFEQFDNICNVRRNMILQIQNLWSEYIKFNNLDDNYDLQFSIGGQISVDIFPKGWDKTYCLQFVENKYDTIYFFGDKTEKNGNDYEIYNDSRVIGHKVNDYNETIQLLKSLFL